MNGWETFMNEQIEKGYLLPLRDQLEQEYEHKTIYPAKENIFRALEETPLESVKVVILGQDPYHGPRQAQGFSFSVPETEKIPPSLQNIYKELQNEYHVPVQRSGDLSDWADQGVLLLNTILTVEAGKPLSHSKLGWQTFTDAVLQKLNEQNQPIVFFLWGAQAKKARQFLNNPNHLVLENVHPSPLSASRGFFNSGQFLEADAFLRSHGIEPVNWTQNNRH